MPITVFPSPASFRLVPPKNLPFLFKAQSYDGTTAANGPDVAVMKPSIITLECMVQLNAIASAQPTATVDILVYYTGTVGLYVTKADTLLHWQINTGAGSHTLTYNISSWKTTEIHHVAGVFDGYNQMLYVDGKLVASFLLSIAGTTMTYASSGSFELGIGYQPFDSNFINAKISEVRLWNYARTPGDILYYAFRAVATPQTGLNAYYKSDDPPSVTTITDYSGNANNGAESAGITRVQMNYLPVNSNIQMIPKSPTSVGITKIYPVVTAIHIAAHAPAKQILTQHPAKSTINISVHAPKSVSITKIYPARSVISITAHAPKSVSITKIYPARSVISITAHAPKSVSITKIYPVKSTINISAHAPKLVGITKVYPTVTAIHLAARAVNVKLTQHPARATINISAHAPKTVGISKIYPSRSLIHLAVSSPTIRLTQHVSRAVIHLALPPPKLILISKPIRTIIHLNIPAPMVIFNQVVHPAHTTIAISARNPIVSTAFIRYKFTVKIRKNVNFIVKIPDHHP